MKPEPIFDLAHLGHMELLTPKPDESLKFFVYVMGMTISGRKGDSVYLRGWDDYERTSLKLTASNTSGMEHMALRARSQQALAPRRRAERFGVRDRLDRGRYRSRPGVPLPRPGRPYHRTVLRDRMV
jgi:catechol 2,3-dioxygenase-like lactoylglutathione lyase family enzyme